MKINITFDLEDDDLRAIEALYSGIECKRKADRPRARSWIQATVRSTLEEVGAEYAARLTGLELKAQWEAEDNAVDSTPLHIPADLLAALEQIEEEDHSND